MAQTEKLRMLILILSWKQFLTCLKIQIYKVTSFAQIFIHDQKFVRFDEISQFPSNKHTHDVIASNLSKKQYKLITCNSGLDSGLYTCRGRILTFLIVHSYMSSGVLVSSSSGSFHLGVARRRRCCRIALPTSVCHLHYFSHFYFLFTHLIFHLGFSIYQYSLWVFLILMNNTC